MLCRLRQSPFETKCSRVTATGRRDVAAGIRFRGLGVKGLGSRFIAHKALSLLRALILPPTQHTQTHRQTHVLSPTLCMDAILEGDAKLVLHVQYESVLGALCDSSEVHPVLPSLVVVLSHMHQDHHSGDWRCLADLIQVFYIDCASRPWLDHPCVLCCSVLLAFAASCPGHFDTNRRTVTHANRELFVATSCCDQQLARSPGIDMLPSCLESVASCCCCCNC